jgi:NADP-dependent 3-hydroxy acid dehydrogenase YdfG
VHVVHIVVDGGIRSSRRPDDGRDTLLDPDAIAEAAWAVVAQPRNAWSHEIEVRPWVENF